jgi:hypothetical protein
MRKLSEGSYDLSLRRVKQKITSAKIPSIPSTKLAKISNSPYVQLNKISKTPSYALIQPYTASSLKKSHSNSSVRSRNKDSKNSFNEELTFLNQPPSNPLENLKTEAKKLRSKFISIETSYDSTNINDKFIELFPEIIEKDIIFGQLLKKIKISYEEKISKIQNETSKAVNSLNDQILEKASYVRMLERISKENIQIGKEVQRLESICTELQSTLNKIRNVNIESVPRNEDDWRALIYENSQYSILCKNMKSDIKDYQYKEEQLIKLIDALKERGYPVDQVYEEDVRSKTDTEMNSSKSLDTSKYNKIPTLELSKLLKSSDSLL